MTNGYYGAFYDQFVFLRAVGVSSSGEINCYYLVDNKVAAVNIDNQNNATGIYLTDYDEQGFVEYSKEDPQPLFVTTTIEELTRTYLGQNILDY